jgi:hypothetical protein
MPTRGDDEERNPARPRRALAREATPGTAVVRAAYKRREPDGTETSYALEAPAGLVSDLLGGSFEGFLRGLLE